MDRSRSGSRSSSDSWSIIERNCSGRENVQAVEEDDASSICSSEEIELAEEAFDSHDSDIEIHEESECESDCTESDSDLSESEGDDEEEEEQDVQYSDEEEEEVEEAEEENGEEGVEEGEDEEEQEEMEDEEEDSGSEHSDESEDEEAEESGDEETEEKADCEMVSEDDVMEGDGLRYVPPEKIRERLTALNNVQFDSKEKLLLAVLLTGIWILMAVAGASTLYKLTTPQCEGSESAISGLQCRNAQLKSLFAEVRSKHINNNFKPLTLNPIPLVVEEPKPLIWHNYPLYSVNNTKTCKRKVAKTAPRTNGRHVRSVRILSTSYFEFNTTDRCDLLDGLKQKIVGPPTRSMYPPKAVVLPRHSAFRQGMNWTSRNSICLPRNEKPCVAPSVKPSIVALPPKPKHMKFNRKMETPKATPICLPRSEKPCFAASVKPTTPLPPRPKQRKLNFKVEVPKVHPICVSKPMKPCVEKPKAKPMRSIQPPKARQTKPNYKIEYEREQKAFFQAIKDREAAKNKNALQLHKKKLELSVVKKEKHQKIVEKIAKNHYSPKRASQLMRRVNLEKDQCMRREKVGRVKKSAERRPRINRQKRILYKVDAPCRARYNVASSLTKSNGKKLEFKFKKVFNTTSKRTTKLNKPNFQLVGRSGDYDNISDRKVDAFRRRNVKSAHKSFQMFLRKL